MRELTTDEEELRSYRDPSLVKQNSEKWHEIRSIRLGASDAPKACGCSPYATPEQLLTAKREQCLGSRPSPTAAQQRGLANEDSIVEEFLQLYNQACRGPEEQVIAHQTGIWISPQHPHLAASPDRILTNEAGSVVALLVAVVLLGQPHSLLMHALV